MQAFALVCLISLCTYSASTEEAEEPKQSADLIVLGDHVVTMNDHRAVISKGAVAVRGGVILEVGRERDVLSRYESNDVIPGTNRVVLPGLVNGHTHAAMTLFRGIADDLELMEWLNNYIFPLERSLVNAEFVRIGSDLACWEMIRGGTTTFVDMYFFEEETAKSVERCGVRAILAVGNMPARLGLEKLEGPATNIPELVKEKMGVTTDRVRLVHSAHSPYTVSTERLEITRREANWMGVRVKIHVAESPYELDYTNENFGMTPVNYLNSIGMLDGAMTAAHMVWPDADEIKLLAEKGIGVIHNPTSNMKLASGVSPVTDMLAAGVSVGLGTDGAASNNDLDMWEEIKIASLLQKVSRLDPKALPAEAVLYMATRGSAEAVGLGDVIGQLTSGYQADLIQVELDDVHHIPIYNVLSHLANVTDEQDVRTVVVQGKLLYDGEEFLTLDTERIRSEVKTIETAIKQKLAESTDLRTTIR